MVKDNVKSTLISRNITVLGKRTSVRLEPEMWSALKEISNREKCKIHDICSLISLRKNKNTSLTAAIRVFIMLYFRAAATEDGHARSGHGDFSNMVARARTSLEVLRSQKKNSAAKQQDLVDVVGDLDDESIEPFTGIDDGDIEYSNQSPVSGTAILSGRSASH